MYVTLHDGNKRQDKMRLMLSISHKLWIGLVFAMTLCEIGVAADAPTPVELWVSGDDVLSRRFLEGVKECLFTSYRQKPAVSRQTDAGWSWKRLGNERHRAPDRVAIGGG